MPYDIINDRIKKVENEFYEISGIIIRKVFEVLEIQPDTAEENAVIQRIINEVKEEKIFPSELKKRTKEEKLKELLDNK